MQIKTGITNARFFVPVGITRQERQNGNHIRVDIAVKVEAREAAEQDDINKTADYAKFYRIASRNLNKEKNLLEAYLLPIGQEIQEAYPEAKQIFIRLSKLNPQGLRDTELSYVEWDWSDGENS